MATPKLNRRTIWRLSVSTKAPLTHTDRDFLAELVSEEAHNASRGYSFVLHDMSESAHYCELYVEASRTVLQNLLAVLKSNVPYKIAVTEWGKYNSV